MERREITEDTRKKLLYILDRLRMGYTGDFHVRCNEGGIQWVREDHKVDVDGVEARALARERELA